VRSAAAAPNGDLWLGSGVRVLRGHPNRSWAVAYRHPNERMQWMDGPGTAGEELFVLTQEGTLIHHLDDAWTEVDRFEARPGEERYGDVLWLGAQRASLFAAAAEEYVVYDHGQIATTFSSHTALEKLSALSRTGDGRIALMATGGIVLEAIGASLVRSTTHDFANDVFSMAPIRDGFAYARRGLVPSYGELEKADCVGDPPGLEHHVATKVVPLGEQLVVFGADSGVHDDGPGPSIVMIVSFR
jgi:hypothetical protein